jgi:hypothetical protein
MLTRTDAASKSESHVVVLQEWIGCPDESFGSKLLCVWEKLEKISESE